LNLVHSKGFHPMPKVSFACALPVGTESLQETIDIELAESLDIPSSKKCIDQQLPPGINVTLIEEITLDKKKQRLKESHFLITLNGAELNKEDLEEFLKSDYFAVVKVNKKGEHRINVRPLVKSMSLIPPNKIKLALKHTAGPELKPAEIVKTLFSLKDLHVNDIKTVKTKQVLA